MDNKPYLGVRRWQYILGKIEQSLGSHLISCKSHSNVIFWHRPILITLFQIPCPLPTSNPHPLVLLKLCSIFPKTICVGVKAKILHLASNRLCALIALVVHLLFPLCTPSLLNLSQLFELTRLSLLWRLWYMFFFLIELLSFPPHPYTGLALGSFLSLFNISSSVKTLSRRPKNYYFFFSVICLSRGQE